MHVLGVFVIVTDLFGVYEEEVGVVRVRAAKDDGRRGHGGGGVGGEV